MATYSLSGTGVQALSANVTALHVTISTLPAVAGSGRANPTNHYQVGLLRLGDAVGYFDGIAVVGGPQWLAVPTGTTRLGYALEDTAVISVVEVIGGSPPFGSISALAGLSDVALASPADTQLLTYQSSTSKWINAAPPTPGTPAFHGARIFATTTQSIPSNTSTKLAFQSVDFDTDAFAALATLNTRLTVPSGLAGYYLIGASLKWQANNQNQRQSSLLINNSVEQIMDVRAAGLGDPSQAWVTLRHLNVGDYVENRVYQSATSAVSTDVQTYTHPDLWLKLG